MPRSFALSHVAMSVPEGTLTDEYRARLLEFYGRMLGWREMESLRLTDRLTGAVGSSSYINIRERPDSMVSHGYEHFGVLVRTAEEFQRRGAICPGIHAVALHRWEMRPGDDTPRSLGPCLTS